MTSARHFTAAQRQLLAPAMQNRGANAARLAAVSAAILLLGAATAHARPTRSLQQFDCTAAQQLCEKQSCKGGLQQRVAQLLAGQLPNRRCLVAPLCFSSFGNQPGRGALELSLPPSSVQESLISSATQQPLRPTAPASAPAWCAAACGTAMPPVLPRTPTTCVHAACSLALALQLRHSAGSGMASWGCTRRHCVSHNSPPAAPTAAFFCLACPRHRRAASLAHPPSPPPPARSGCRSCSWERLC